MTRILIVTLPAAALALSGCLSTVGTIVTAPVKMASWGVDKATTSQSESDRNYGRKMRKAEARQGKEDRKRAREAKRDGDRDNGG